QRKLWAACFLSACPDPSFPTSSFDEDVRSSRTRSFVAASRTAAPLLIASPETRLDGATTARALVANETLLCPRERSCCCKRSICRWSSASCSSVEGAVKTSSTLMAVSVMSFLGHGYLHVDASSERDELRSVRAVRGERHLNAVGLDVRNADAAEFV